MAEIKAHDQFAMQEALLAVPKTGEQRTTSLAPGPPVERINVLSNLIKHVDHSTIARDSQI